MPGARRRCKDGSDAGRYTEKNEPSVQRSRLGMRWPIVRLIWLRELRDQLRDRRTVFMIAVLPVLLYPVLGFGVLQFAVGFLRHPGVVGIYGSEHLPVVTPYSAAGSPVSALAWLSLTPASSPGQPAAAAALAHVGQLGLGPGAPPLFLLDPPDDSGGLPAHFAPDFLDAAADAAPLHLRVFPAEPDEES